MLLFQFANPHVEAFDFFEGDQMYFPQESDDPGLVAVHARIIAVVVALGGCSGPRSISASLARRRGLSENRNHYGDSPGTRWRIHRSD